ncbi:LysE family translocator [Aestuariibius sp. HNIBRBA575]|uniref:LysE family translocator n=1 Tax=Aestuariibius sp. HNIBRBA575 TaxID=3233343 RepID=UPI0034A36A1B
MTLSAFDLLLYAGGLFALFLTPGPVWVALIARSLAGGFRAAWPLALGVVIGDVVWAVLAVLGVSWILSIYGGFLELLRWIAAIIFLAMGYLIIKSADKSISSDSRLTRPGAVAGFLAGLAVIFGNPKAVLFYMGVLPGFFDLSHLTTLDIVLIAGLSALVPLVGNLILAVFIDRARSMLSSPQALKRTNITAGLLLILVGLAIPFV